MQQRQRPKTRRQPEASRRSTESRGRSAAEKTAEKRAEKTAEEAKCNQNIRAGTHEAVRRELVAKNPGGGVGGQLDGHREEKRRDPKKTGSQRGAEEAERDPERTEVTGGEEERGWILCLKRFQLETDRFLDKAHFYHIRTDLN